LGGFAKDNDTGDKVQMVWRVEKPLGYGLMPPAEMDEPRFRAIPISTPPRVIVIDDGALGFRCERARHRWPFAQNGRALPDWIVLKMAAPIAQGDLWRYLLQPELA